MKTKTLRKQSIVEMKIYNHARENKIKVERFLKQYILLSTNLKV